MVWGIKNDKLVLVKESDSQKLVFDQLESSYPLETLKVMALKPSNHKGKGVVIKDKIDQHGHGMVQMLAIGDES